MFWRLMPALLPIACLSIAACTTVATAPGPYPIARTPIIAVAADDVGVVASANPQSQGANLTVGYKGAKFAILPVESGRGNLLGIRTANGVETYSIFTQLGLDARAGASSGVAVEQVLAVGPAADRWVARASPVPQPLTPPVIPVGQ
jgi:hypothetical protein